MLIIPTAVNSDNEVSNATDCVWQISTYFDDIFQVNSLGNNFWEWSGLYFYIPDSGSENRTFPPDIGLLKGY